MKTRRAYIPPASHWASTSRRRPGADGHADAAQADYDISGFSPQAQVILQALKNYGMIVADNGGDNFITGAPDPRWDMAALRHLRRVTTKDFEVVDMTGMVADQPRR